MNIFFFQFKFLCELTFNRAIKFIGKYSQTQQVVFDYILPIYFMILYNTMGMSHLKNSIEQYNFLFPSILQNLKWWSTMHTMVL